MHGVWWKTAKRTFLLKCTLSSVGFHSKTVGFIQQVVWGNSGWRMRCHVCLKNAQIKNNKGANYYCTFCISCHDQWLDLTQARVVIIWPRKMLFRTCKPFTIFSVLASGCSLVTKYTFSWLVLTHRGITFTVLLTRNSESESTIFAFLPEVEVWIFLFPWSSPSNQCLN